MSASQPTPPAREVSPPDVDWWRNAVVYCLNVKTFRDADNDGLGDLQGLLRCLDYLGDLGVTCIWLQPLFPSPGTDDGYDIADYYTVDSRLGRLDEFDDVLRRAEELGIRVLLDLAVNHTSTAHPWFRAACCDRPSRYRSWYVFAREPPHWPVHLEFPGESPSNWAWDDTAGRYYLHRYYPSQADLNFANPDVRAEIGRILAFWLDRGVAGFRLDTLPWLVETARALDPRRDPHEDLAALCEEVRRQRPDAVLLGEANGHVDEQVAYFGANGRQEVTTLLNFDLNRSLWLALARGDADPLRACLGRLRWPSQLVHWANFLRNHDELNLDRLAAAERTEVVRRFSPEPDTWIYGRGIRRRAAPMLDDGAHLRNANSLLLSLPGTPVLLYGEEIGLGDNLRLPMRMSVRTPMQWSNEPNQGFSEAASAELVRPLATSGPRTNVASQQRDPGSLLNWFRRTIRVRRSCPELGAGAWEVLDAGERQVLAHACHWRGGSVVALHNLAPTPTKVRLALHGLTFDELLSDTTYESPSPDCPLPLGRYGYRWFRVFNEPGADDRPGPARSSPTLSAAPHSMLFG